MDIGDWVFLGMIAISGIASISKASKKKASAQTSEQPMSEGQVKSDADEWIKKIIRESTKGLLDDDEFIPKNETKPSAERSEKPKPTPSFESSRPNAEQYRRTNQSLEGAARPQVSLEKTDMVEGKVNHTGLHASASVTNIGIGYDQPIIDPIDDLRDADEVRKALIYGEIMRTKF